MPLLIIIALVLVIIVLLWVRHQRILRQRAWLMREAIRNRDFSFRLPTKGLPRQETLNELGNTIREQVNQNEVDTWERLTRVLTHEIMNATAPITSISQSLLNHPDVKGSEFEDGVKAIYDTSRHLSEFVSNYRKMSELEQPMLSQRSQKHKRACRRRYAAPSSDESGEECRRSRSSKDCHRSHQRKVERFERFERFEGFERFTPRTVCRQ